jgi:RNA polymerase sigma-70 factor (ECF subfamily)
MAESTEKVPIDETITSLLQSRNQRALILLYEHYSPALYNIIHRIVRSDEIAEETLQDCLLKIWDKADQFDPEKGRLFTWMVRLCRNLAIDKIRSSQFKKGNKTESMPDYVNDDDRLSEAPNVSDPGLRKVVEQLDEKSRLVIELLFFQDYTQKEASEALDIPLGTIKSRSRKALLDLRNILGKEGLIALYLFTVLEIVKKYFGA